MAAPLRKTRQEEVRRKIQVSCLINKLQNHVDGKIELTQSQVQCAKILLDKSLSNAPTINEHSGIDGGAITVSVNVTFK